MKTFFLALNKVRRDDMPLKSINHFINQSINQEKKKRKLSDVSTKYSHLFLNLNLKIKRCLQPEKKERKKNSPG